MTNINPPVDREEARDRPTYMYRDSVSGIEIRMGPKKQSDTRPEKSWFRYVILISGPDQEIWQGYLYEEGNDVNVDRHPRRRGS